MLSRTRSFCRSDSASAVSCRLRRGFANPQVANGQEERKIFPVWGHTDDALEIPSPELAREAGGCLPPVGFRRLIYKCSCYLRELQTFTGVPPSVRTSKHREPLCISYLSVSVFPFSSEGPISRLRKKELPGKTYWQTYIRLAPPGDALQVVTEETMTREISIGGCRSLVAVEASVC